MIFGPGTHKICSPFVSVQKYEIPLCQPQIIHGTNFIVTVPQGFVGLAMDRGQPVLLPPGLHQWQSSTMTFDKLIDLSSPVIQIGPYTLLTVDQGYSAITQDNGEQKVLAGGRTYMLTHRNWKFEKFMTEKIQTDDVGPITATTGDNVPLETLATVNWRVGDPALAARMAANTMGGKAITQREDIAMLRMDVLKQATASLAAYIGTVRYSEGQHVSAQIAQAKANDGPSGALFDQDSLDCAVKHANRVCKQYGVLVISINVISASPSDNRLLEALSLGAVAAAQAEQAETAARGLARAEIISAEADAEARRIRAKGAADAARALEQAGDVAMDIALLEKAGDSVKGCKNTFVAASPAELPEAFLAAAAAA